MLDNTSRNVVFIHKGHKYVNEVARKPPIHAGVKCNILKTLLKSCGQFLIGNRKKLLHA